LGLLGPNGRERRRASTCHNWAYCRDTGCGQRVWARHLRISDVSAGATVARLPTAREGFDISRSHVEQTCRARLEIGEPAPDWRAGARCADGTRFSITAFAAEPPRRWRCPSGERPRCETARALATQRIHPSPTSAGRVSIQIAVAEHSGELRCSIVQVADRTSLLPIQTVA